MNTSKKAITAFLSWSVLGLLCGALLAAVMSALEYCHLAEMTGSLLHGDALPRALKTHSPSFYSQGNDYLSHYGYSPFRNWNAYFPITVGVSLLLFYPAGVLLFWRRYREEKNRQHRILELTEYLRTINAGKPALLCRKEDEFSYLEDEIYKTVTGLKSVQEETVKNHTLLSERIADIAHQLKTPLTSMTLMTELLEAYQTQETEEYLLRLSQQIERLKSLIAGLLALAKLDTHEILFQKQTLDLSELLESALEALREILDVKKLQINIENGNPDGCFICADRSWTEEALINVLKNCAEHTPVHGTIFISCQQNPLYTALQIQDSGDGFDPKDLPHIFERFYRGKHAAKDSAGIGLALAKAVMEQQNGHIYAENTADGHASFLLKWYETGS